jgi:hypothetical protein
LLVFFLTPSNRAFEQFQKEERGQTMPPSLSKLAEFFSIAGLIEMISQFWGAATSLRLNWLLLQLFPPWRAIFRYLHAAVAVKADDFPKSNICPRRLPLN